MIVEAVKIIARKDDWQLCLLECDDLTFFVMASERMER